MHSLSLSLPLSLSGLLRLRRKVSRASRASEQLRASFEHFRTFARFSRTLFLNSSESSFEFLPEIPVPREARNASYHARIVLAPFSSPPPRITEARLSPARNAPRRVLR